MIQIKVFRKMKMFRFKTQVRLCYPLASLILAFFLVTSCLSSCLNVHECALQYWTFFTQRLLPLWNFC